MTDNEVALLIEQSRQTHDLVRDTYDLLRQHIDDDKLVADTVIKHSTYFGFMKWAAITVVTFLLGLIGYKAH
ncbi:MAG: hypothetical protein L0287_09050 [Anaerolineae bacterium]|nr:hypothetical protein [Anaerolineae bacterium]